MPEWSSWEQEENWYSEVLPPLAGLSLAMSIIALITYRIYITFLMKYLLR